MLARQGRLRRTGLVLLMDLQSEPIAAG